MLLASALTMALALESGDGTRRQLSTNLVGPDTMDACSAAFYQHFYGPTLNDFSSWLTIDYTDFCTAYAQRGWNCSDSFSTKCPGLDNPFAIAFGQAPNGPLNHTCDPATSTDCYRMYHKTIESECNNATFVEHACYEATEQAPCDGPLVFANIATLEQDCVDFFTDCMVTNPSLDCSTYVSPADKNECKCMMEFDQEDAHAQTASDMNPSLDPATGEPLRAWHCRASLQSSEMISETWQKCHDAALPPPSPPPASANGDPHLTFAHGGTADFRGVDGKHFVMLSAPNVQFSMRTNNATHDLKSMDTEWRWKRVDGSFFTEAAWVVRGLSKKLYGVSTDAATNGAKIYALDGPIAKEIANPTGAWREWAKDGLRVTVRQISVSVATQGWETTVTKKPVYNSVLGPTQRLDMRMRPCTGGHCGVPSRTCHPHGIVGQSYDGDSTAISGQKDSYNQKGSTMTTTAMAEGAIEGDGLQYALTNMFSTEFKYSRFDRSRNDECDFRDVSKLSKLTRAVNAEGTDDGFASSEERGVDFMEYAAEYEAIVD